MSNWLVLIVRCLQACWLIFLKTHLSWLQITNWSSRARKFSLKKYFMKNHTTKVKFVDWNMSDTKDKHKHTFITTSNNFFEKKSLEHSNNNYVKVLKPFLKIMVNQNWKKCTFSKKIKFVFKKIQKEILIFLLLDPCFRVNFHHYNIFFTKISLRT